LQLKVRRQSWKYSIRSSQQTTIISRISKKTLWHERV